MSKSITLFVIIHPSHESAHRPVTGLAGKVVGWEHIGHHQVHRVTVGKFYIGYTNPHKNIT